MSGNQSLIVNGWSIYAHLLFLDQFEELITTVENLRQKNPETYRSKNATKRLAAIAKLAFEIIPADPTRTEYRLGNTLGEDYKHWFRAKFFQQYRLFFRYHQSSKIIVYAWINDDGCDSSQVKLKQLTIFLALEICGHDCAGIPAVCGIANIHQSRHWL